MGVMDSTGISSFRMISHPRRSGIKQSLTTDFLNFQTGIIEKLIRQISTAKSISRGLEDPVGFKWGRVGWDFCG